MNLSGSTFRPRARLAVGWVLLVLGTFIGATGPAMSGATVFGGLLIVAGGALVVSVLHARAVRREAADAEAERVSAS